MRATVQGHETGAGVLEKYRVGLLVREPTFCDTSYKRGGFVAPHRFLIISSNARCLDGLLTEDPGWGLCIFLPNRIFKVIDTIGDGVRTQITLLDVPEDLVEFFSRIELNQLERAYVEQARKSFRESLHMKPLQELDNKRWKDRLVFPIGINDQGCYFSLRFDAMTPGQAVDPAQLGFSLSRVLNHQAQVHLAAGDLAEADTLLAEAIELEKARDKPDQAELAKSCLLLQRSRGTV